MDGTMATDETRAWRRRPRPAQASAIHAQYSAYRIGMREARGSVLRYLHETTPDGRTFEGALSPAGRCGVVASSDGRSMIALDCDGRRSLGVATCADVVYEGEVDGDGTPMGYGVGSFANGYLFAGHWVTGRPEGLGQLTTALDPDASSTAGYGWYFEQRAMQLVRAPDAPTPPPDLGVRRPVEQPLLGLYIVGRVLETNRLRRCQHALGLWATRVCHYSVMTAIAARGLAYESWRQAHAAKEASARTVCTGLRAKGPADPALHARLDAVLGRQRLARDRDAIRHKRTAKARQVQTTTTCLGIERNATALMQVELDDLEAELRDARAAQARCTLIQNEMMSLRQTIEDRKVTLHALRRHHRIQPPPPRRPSSTTTLPDVPPLPSDEIAFLCGVPGCACGVPKDVFRRVGAALSGRDC